MDSLLETNTLNKKLEKEQRSGYTMQYLPAVNQIKPNTEHKLCET